MKILYVLNSAQHGGMERHVMDLAAGMKSRGHDVFVWMPEGPVSDELKRAGCEIVNIAMGFDIDPVYIITLVKFLRKNKIDIVHAHELKAVTNATLAAFFARVRTRISHTHTPISEWQIGGFRKAINVFGYSVLVNLFSTVEIALTESRKSVKIKEGISHTKLEIIPNGVDVGSFDPSNKSAYRSEILRRYNIAEDVFIFGVIGRISEEKGHFVLIEAFKELLVHSSVDYEKVCLLIVGGGPKETELNRQIEDLGLQEKITVTGKFSTEDHKKFYAALDCFVHPSLAEGFGIVLIEAMAAGLPTICSDLDVLQEVGGSTVYYFETGDSKSLAEKMYNVYSKGNELENLTSGAHSRVKELYSLDTFINNYEDLYQRLLEESK